MASGPRTPVSCRPDALDVAYEWDNKNDTCGELTQSESVAAGPWRVCPRRG
jgi:hypothetical protein